MLGGSQILIIYVIFFISLPLVRLRRGRLVWQGSVPVRIIFLVVNLFFFFIIASIKISSYCWRLSNRLHQIFPANIIILQNQIQENLS